MRKPKYILALTAAIIFVTACNNKLNVLAPYKSEAVVYGLMDQSDTAHYIRVYRSFEGNGDAYVMASNYDSVYYPAKQLNVQLNCFNSQGTQTATIPLTADSSIPLPSGTFPYPKQMLYKTKTKLSLLDAVGGNNTYQLVITNKKTGQVLSGSTMLLSDISFTRGISGSQFALNYSTTSPSSLQWLSVSGSRIYQLTIRFWYYEKIGSNPGYEQHLDWVFAPLTASTLQGGESMEYDYNQQGFYQLVKNSIPIIGGVYRHADSMGVVFTTGSDDFNTYIQLSQPSLGIDQDPPSFSDVKNGIGIYTARHTQTIMKQVDSRVFDSLVNDPSLTAYGFQN